MPMSPAEYVAQGGNMCPYCGSFDVTGGFVEIGHSCASQLVFCNVCARSWYDYYELKGYENAHGTDDHADV